MPFFVDRELNVYEKNPVVSLPEFKSTYLVSDTESTKHLKKLIVDCIGIYLPELISDYLVVFTYDELTVDFHPVHSALKAFGYNINFASEDGLVSVVDDIQEIFNDAVDCTQTTRKVNKAFRDLMEQGYFDDQIADLNVDPNCLSLQREKSTGEYTVILKPPKIDIQLLFFYGFADLFKIWGKKHQHKLLESNLTQQRSLKLRNKYGRKTPIVEYNRIDGRLYEFNYDLGETMYRFPPRSKGLDAQTSIFEVKTRKINIHTRIIANALGSDNINFAIENFTQFLKKFPKLALQYNATDIFATWDLHLKQQEFYDVILKSFDLEPLQIADTTGSNVSKFIIESIDKKFNALDKESQKLVSNAIALGGITNLEETPLNDFGCQPFLTVGGLLYSRMSKVKLLLSFLSDCDLKSCYASFMSMMNVYLGEPVILTCKYDKYKFTLREALEIIEEQKAPHDGWFIRVSGKLDKAINTLVMSDLKFKPKNIKQQKLYEICDNRKSIEGFNAYKTSKRQAQSIILIKQIIFGLISKSTIEALKKLPNDWYEEYLNLKCDVVCFYPGDLIADNIADYQKIRDSLPDHEYIEKFDMKRGKKIIESQYYKNNVCLAFPISKYWIELKEKRAEFKKAKDPIQEVLKLFGNSGYGVLACLYLITNNLMASNQITAAARSGAWLMTNALNGMGSITDGTGFSWPHIPLGKTFHEIVNQNPKYLQHFDESIKSGIEITPNFDFQGWIDKNLKQHLMDFYQVDESDYNLQQFDYELKTEVFLTKSGKEWFENNAQSAEELKYELGIEWDKYLLKQSYMAETALFTKFYNTNAGNYCKAIDDEAILIDGNEYDLVDNEAPIKARSFQDLDKKLVKWYTKSIEDKYTEPLIYSEKKLIKFGDGNKIAISLLESGSEEIVHPMGFETTAYKIMKLITRSQFLFETEVQLRNFETNEVTLSELTKSLGLNQKTFWNNLKSEDVLQYGVEMRTGVDYFTYAKYHPTGIGFELLALAPSVKGDINLVRQKIVELIEKGCKDFNAGLAITRNLKNGIPLKNIFAAVIIAKKNAEDDLRQLLENSTTEPTLLTVNRDNIRRLRELMNNSEDED
ncbi:hypothetical protein [Nostoc sp. 2RC]|uniref:hypothetical protein n=1 Tax=Nostoc sp. 2RC TaxID=2485484 RepID=UPI001624E07E|nr:hypothetical protein [Nostoc sp. 2RC]MBC1238498.1 hypothetical protein [Nostoc sp. 2RC]